LVSVSGLGVDFGSAVAQEAQETNGDAHMGPRSLVKLTVCTISDDPLVSFRFA